MSRKGIEMESVLETGKRLSFLCDEISAATARGEDVAIYVGCAGVPNRTRMGSFRPHIIASAVHEMIGEKWLGGAFCRFEVNGRSVSCEWLPHDDCPFFFSACQQKCVLFAEVQQRIGHDMDEYVDKNKWNHNVYQS